MKTTGFVVQRDRDVEELPFSRSVSWIASFSADALRHGISAVKAASTRMPACSSTP